MINQNVTLKQRKKSTVNSDYRKGELGKGENVRDAKEHIFISENNVTSGKIF